LLGPKVAKVMIGCPVFVDDDTIAQVSRESRFFYAVGQACYEDILRPGVPYITEYSDRIINMRREGNNLVFTAANFGAHNCADEDCPDYNTACRTIGTDKRK
jgi:hypothetical protein